MQPRNWPLVIGAIGFALALGLRIGLEAGMRLGLRCGRSWPSNIGGLNG